MFSFLFSVVSKALEQKLRVDGTGCGVGYNPYDKYYRSSWRRFQDYVSLLFFFHFIIFSIFDESWKSSVAVGVLQYDDCATLPRTCVENYEKINDQ